MRLDWLKRVFGGRASHKAAATAARYKGGVRAVTDAPVPRTSRWLLAGMLLFLVALLAWASLGRMDIVAFAQGRTAVSSRVQPVQSVERGRVTEVLVEEGEHVEANQPVAHLQKDSAAARVQSLAYRLDKARAARARLTALLGASADAPPEIGGLDEVAANIVASERALMASQWASHRQRMEELRQEYRNQMAKRETTQSKIESIEAVLPYLRSRVERLEKLADQEATSLVKLDKARRERVAKSEELRVQKRRLAEVEGRVEVAKNKLEATRTEFRAKRREALADKSKEIARIERQLTDARSQLERATLRAPISGVVQDVAVNVAGTVVEPAQKLMRIVPENRPVEVRAKILNKDIGFASEGQQVDVKFDTFDFTRYGAVPGVIRHISRTSTEDKEQGRVYHALVELERNTIEVNGREVKLRPGLTATVDIDMGQRRIIEYFLGPILRYRDQALRER